MLIRLNPIPPDPSVFYTVTYPDALGRVALPTGWALTLHALQADDFECPTTPHALDKATWLSTILMEVAFDLVSLTVICSFIDGNVARWPISDFACVKALEEVLADVKQSTMEVDRERASFDQSRRMDMRSKSPSPEPIPGKPAKHKRQRSLLMSLVACVNKLVTNMSLDGAAHGPMPTKGSHSFQHQQPPLISKPFSSESQQDIFGLGQATMDMVSTPQRGVLRRTPPLLPATFLRLRARSALVDICRKYVITYLAGKMAPGRYHAWIARSLLSHTEQQMVRLIQEAGGGDFDLLRMSPPRDVMSADTSFSMTSSPLVDDEESFSETISTTDTDGSSLHTPVDSPTAPAFVYAAPEQSNSRFPRTPSPPSFSPQDVAEYTALSGQRLRLHALISRIDSIHANIAAEERSHYAVLEIKSRRRAWSNRKYLGGANVSDAGLATPLRSSPLGLFMPVTPESLDSPSSMGSADVDQGLQVTSIDANMAKLFPVSEDDEEDTLEEICSASVRLVSDVTLQDMENGLLHAPIARPATRPRTQSMHPPLTLNPLSVPVPVSASVSVTVGLHIPSQNSTSDGGLTSSSLLCQPFSEKILQSEKNEIELSERPVSVVCSSESEVVDGAEFTLAMDLPPPYTKLQPSKFNEDGRKEWFQVRGVMPCS